jgi:hypothetical protein
VAQLVASYAIRTQKINNEIMTKTIWLSFVVLFFVSVSDAQIKAVTETGDEVILYQNGSWKYAKDFADADSIKINNAPFKKSNNATFLLKSEKGMLGYWIDPKKWNFKKAQANPDAEYELDRKGESLQGVIITEASEIPIESYVAIALENGKAAAPDLHITNKEYRTVNDLKVLFLQMEGTQTGIKFCYNAYYFSDSAITVQFVTYTYKNMMTKYSKDIEELLNGLVKIKSTESLPAREKQAEPVDKANAPAQGSLSANNNCKPLFTGNWKYNILDAADLKRKLVTVERTFNTTTEFIDNYYFTYDNKWINNCLYEITFKKTNKPNYKLINTGEVITVEITFIDKKVMKYRTTFRGEIREGEMMRKD